MHIFLAPRLWLSELPSTISKWRPKLQKTIWRMIKSVPPRLFEISGFVEWSLFILLSYFLWLFYKSCLLCDVFWLGLEKKILCENFKVTIYMENIYFQIYQKGNKSAVYKQISYFQARTSQLKHPILSLLPGTWRKGRNNHRKCGGRNQTDRRLAARSHERGDADV